MKVENIEIMQKENRNGMQFTMNKKWRVKEEREGGFSYIATIRIL